MTIDGARAWAALPPSRLPDSLKQLGVLDSGLWADTGVQSFCIKTCLFGQPAPTHNLVGKAPTHLRLAGAQVISYILLMSVPWPAGPMRREGRKRRDLAGASFKHIHAHKCVQ